MGSKNAGRENTARRWLSAVQSGLNVSGSLDTEGGAVALKQILAGDLERWGRDIARALLADAGIGGHQRAAVSHGIRHIAGDADDVAALRHIERAGGVEIHGDDLDVGAAEGLHGLQNVDARGGVGDEDALDIRILRQQSGGDLRCFVRGGEAADFGDGDVRILLGDGLEEGVVAGVTDVVDVGDRDGEDLALAADGISHHLGAVDAHVDDGVRDSADIFLACRVARGNVAHERQLDACLPQWVKRRRADVEVLRLAGHDVRVQRGEGFHVRLLLDGVEIAAALADDLDVHGLAGILEADEVCVVPLAGVDELKAGGEVHGADLRQLLRRQLQLGIPGSGAAVRADGGDGLGGFDRVREGQAFGRNVVSIGIIAVVGGGAGGVGRGSVRGGVICGAVGAAGKQCQRHHDGEKQGDALCGFHGYLLILWV